MRLNALTLAAACSLAIAGCSRAEDASKVADPKAAAAKDLPPVDKAFGDKVRAYLLQHPEVIKEAIDQYNTNMETQAAGEAQAAIVKNRAALERDPRDFVANPGGKVTVVEFYDYRCGYCIAAAPHVMELIASNPDVRVVFKELAILGPTSERAAHAVLAIKRAGGDYLAAHKALMTSKPLDDAAIDRVLAANKLPASAADKVHPEDARHMEETRKLAGEVGVTGTPAFIVGDTLISGADMEALALAVAKAKGG